METPETPPEDERGEQNELGYRDVDEEAEHDESGGTQGPPGEPERSDQ